MSILTVILYHIITDIDLSFEMARYDVKEEDVELNDFIHIVKENNRTTEQILDVFVLFSQNSGRDFAVLGED